MAIKPVIAPHLPAHHGSAVKPAVVAKNAFTRLYAANQSDDLAKRPGYPAPGHPMKLAGGATLEDLGLKKLPHGSAAAKAVAKVIREGVDGDQDAFKLKVGGKTFLVVGVFPEDAARDQIWIWDAKGQHQVAYAEPNEETGKLHWK